MKIQMDLELFEQKKRVEESASVSCYLLYINPSAAKIN